MSVCTLCLHALCMHFEKRTVPALYLKSHLWETECVLNGEYLWDKETHTLAYYRGRAGLMRLIVLKEECWSPPRPLSCRLLHSTHDSPNWKIAGKNRCIQTFHSPKSTGAMSHSKAPFATNNLITNWGGKNTNTAHPIPVEDCLFVHSCRVGHDHWIRINAGWLWQGIMPGLCVVSGGFVFRWTEMQCSPVFSGNFTPSGHTVKVTSGHKVAKIEGFTFVVRIVFFLVFCCSL